MDSFSSGEVAQDATDSGGGPMSASSVASSIRFGATAATAGASPTHPNGSGPDGEERLRSGVTGRGGANRRDSHGGANEPEVPSTSSISNGNGNAAFVKVTCEHVNWLLELCSIRQGEPVKSLKQCSSSLFVLLFQRLLNVNIPNIEVEPNTSEKKLWNIRRVLEELQSLLQINLTDESTAGDSPGSRNPYYISALEIVNQNEEHISRLIRLFLHLAWHVNSLRTSSTTPAAAPTPMGSPSRPLAAHAGHAGDSRAPGGAPGAPVDALDHQYPSVADDARGMRQIQRLAGGAEIYSPGFPLGIPRYVNPTHPHRNEAAVHYSDTGPRLARLDPTVYTPVGQRIVVRREHAPASVPTRAAPSSSKKHRELTLVAGNEVTERRGAKTRHEKPSGGDSRRKERGASAGAAPRAWSGAATRGPSATTRPGPGDEPQKRRGMSVPAVTEEATLIHDARPPYYYYYGMDPSALYGPHTAPAPLAAAPAGPHEGHGPVSGEEIKFFNSYQPLPGALPHDFPAAQAVPSSQPAQEQETYPDVNSGGSTSVDGSAIFTNDLVQEWKQNVIPPEGRLKCRQQTQESSDPHARAERAHDGVGEASGSPELDSGVAPAGVAHRPCPVKKPAPQRVPKGAPRGDGSYGKKSTGATGSARVGVGKKARRTTYTTELPHGSHSQAHVIGESSRGSHKKDASVVEPTGRPQILMVPGASAGAQAPAPALQQYDGHTHLAYYYGTDADNYHYYYYYTSEGPAPPQADVAPVHLPERDGKRAVANRVNRAESATHTARPKREPDDSAKAALAKRHQQELHDFNAYLLRQHEAATAAAAASTRKCRTWRVTGTKGVVSTSAVAVEPAPAGSRPKVSSSASVDTAVPLTSSQANAAPCERGSAGRPWGQLDGAAGQYDSEGAEDDASDVSVYFYVDENGHRLAISKDEIELGTPIYDIDSKQLVKSTRERPSHPSRHRQKSAKSDQGVSTVAPPTERGSVLRGHVVEERAGEPPVNLYRMPRVINYEARDERIERLRALRFLDDQQKALRSRVLQQKWQTERSLREAIDEAYRQTRQEKIERQRQVRDEDEKYRRAYQMVIESACNDVEGLLARRDANALGGPKRKPVAISVMTAQTARAARRQVQMVQQAEWLKDEVVAMNKEKMRRDVCAYAERVTTWQRCLPVP